MPALMMMDDKSFKTRFLVAGAFGALALIALIVIFRDSPHKLKTPPAPQVIITTGTVKAGDNVATIFDNRVLAPAMAQKVQVQFGKIFDTRRMQPGSNFEIITSTFGQFQKFIYHTSPIHSYSIFMSSIGVFSSEEKNEKTVWIEKRVTGEVTENMYRDLLKQGFDETFVANLVGDLADNIFGWRIDFFTEQRPGDKFVVLMAQEYIEGSDKPLWGGRGRILAASYLGHATRVKENIAIRYLQKGFTKEDYFDNEGNAVRKAFLRAPFTHGAFRVSSGYSNSRFHPILRIYRPHHGTDYAATIGTPVASIGKGRVIFAGQKGGYGNCIEIQHNSKYVSRYGHLSKIAVRQGSSVNQGQYIGKVGNSGLSTGPHLHFEMLVDGSSRNFIKMDFPAASSVSKENLSDYFKARDSMLARLNPPTGNSAQTAATN